MAAKMIGVAAAGFALAANAFMIPSTMTLTKYEADKLEQVDAAKVFGPATTSRLVKMNIHPTSRHTDGPDSKRDVEDVALILDFSTSEDARALNLNGRPFFPHTADLFAHEMPASIPDGLLRTALHDVSAPPHRLFYASKTSTVEAADGTEAELIDMDFQIHGIDDTDIDLDGLSIRILKDEQGRVNIADIIRVPSSSGPAHAAEVDDGEEGETEFTILPIDLDRLAPHHPVPNAHSKAPHTHPSSTGDCRAPAVLCRLKQHLEQKIESMRHTLATHRPHMPFPPARFGCGGKAHGHKMPPGPPNGIHVHGGPNKFAGLLHPPRPGHPGMMDGPGHHPHNGHRGGRHGRHGHRRPGPMHTAVHVARRAFFGFVLPVLIGVAAGMTASIAGMLVGTLLAFLWIKLVRGGRKAQVTEQRAEEGQSSEKVQLLTEGESSREDEDETLPVYVEKE